MSTKSSPIAVPLALVALACLLLGLGFWLFLSSDDRQPLGPEIQNLDEPDRSTERGPRRQDRKPLVETATSDLDEADAVVGTHQIRGRVIDQAGAGVAGALVQLVTSQAQDAFSHDMLGFLRQVTADFQPLKTVVSDRDGHFVCAELSVGSYGLVTEAPGYHFDVSPQITIEDGRSSPELVIQLATGLELKGRVIDAEGQPISGALVIMLPETRKFSGHFFRAKARTNAEGHYAFSNLGAGAIGYACVKDGYCSAGGRIVVEDGTKLDIRLSQGAILEGRVRHQRNGAGIEGVRISFIADGSAVVHDTLSAADGSFRFDTLPDLAGCRFILEKAGLQLVASAGLRVEKSPFLMATIEGLKSAKEPHFQDFFMAGSGQIKGQVLDTTTGLPLAGVQVYVLDESTSQSIELLGLGQAVMTDVEGRFHVDSIPRGHFCVVAHSLSHVLIDESFNRDLLNGQFKAPWRRISNGESIDDVVVLMKPAGVQKGQVLSPEGEPLPGAEIEWWCEPPGESSPGLLGRVLSDSLDPMIALEEGKFQISGLRAEDGLNISATHPRYPGGARLKIAPGDLGREEVQLRLQAGAHLVGRVLDGLGEPVSGLDVQLRALAEGPFQTLGTELAAANLTTTNSLGDFEFRNQQVGAYSLAVESEDYSDPRPRGTSRVELKAGESTEIILNVIRNWKISGEVVNADGKPATGFVVEAKAIDPSGILATEALNRRAGTSTPSQGLGAAEGAIGSRGEFSIERLDGRFSYRLRVFRIAGSGRPTLSSPVAIDDEAEPEASRQVLYLLNGVEVGSRDLKIRLLER